MLCISNIRKGIKTYSKNYEQTDIGYIADEVGYQTKGGYTFEEVDELETVQMLAEEKLALVLESAEKSMRSFQFEGMTFEMSGQPETRLDRFERKLALYPDANELWIALNGTYSLRDPSTLIVDASNLAAFAGAYESKVRSVLSWQEGAKYWLREAATLEDLVAIDPVYHG